MKLRNPTDPDQVPATALDKPFLVMIAATLLLAVLRWTVGGSALYWLTWGAAVALLPWIIIFDLRVRHHRRVVRALSAQKSEFGAGLVVPLVKFSEHLWGGSTFGELEIRQYAKWCKMTPQQRGRKELEAEAYPGGDAARFMMAVKMIDIVGRISADAVSHAIELWMNGASDHFYDLDWDRAPKPLRELAQMALEMGHGFKDKKWTMDDVEHLRVLWRLSALHLDAKLHADTDWGQH